MSGTLLIGIGDPGQCGPFGMRTAGVSFGAGIEELYLSTGDSFLTHDLRLTRTFFNIANLTGYSGTLNAYVRPTATRNATTGVVTVTAPGRNPDFTFGQPTGRVNAVFGSGGPRAFQIAARISF